MQVSLVAVPIGAVPYVPGAEGVNAARQVQGAPNDLRHAVLVDVYHVYRCHHRRSALDLVPGEVLGAVVLQPDQVHYCDIGVLVG